MFDSKKPTLVMQDKGSNPKTSATSGKSGKSVFVSAAKKKAAETRSGNNAVKYSTTGNPFVDQFGKLGSYKQPRSFSEIEKDCEVLWGTDKKLTVLFTFYIRLITRDVKVGDVVFKAQKGAELKHEGIMRMIWLHNKAPQIFCDNIALFVNVGSWKDIMTMLSYDLVYHGWNGRVLNWKKFSDLILAALNDPSERELLKKYLPQIKANSYCTTVESQADNMIGKWICALLYGEREDESGSTYKKYRKLKTSGTAHEWQQLISQHKFNKIDFGKIHGRALNLLVRGKFLKNHGLEAKYQAWVGDAKKVKYTGFVHELFSKLPASLSRLSNGEQETINKQFDTLVAKAGETLTTTLIVVRDTSGSMGTPATGTTIACGDVAKALALYFSAFLKGKFADAWIEFNSDAKMHTWIGNTTLEKWYNDRGGYVGGTDFQSVIDLFVRLKKQGIAEEEFPQGILCISDGEFNPASCLSSTNVEEAKRKLATVFSKEYVDQFVIVLWNLQSGYYGKGTGEKFETYGNVPNVYYFSGYSAATVAFLSGNISNAEELFMEAMNQDVLQLIKV